MAKTKEKRNWAIGAIFTLILFTIIVIIASAVCSTLGIEGQKASIIGGSLETSLITVKNMMTMDGLQYLFQNVVVNFSLFEPMLLLIIVLIGVGIGESSGVWKAFFAPFRKFQTKTLTIIILIISMLSSILLDNSFLIILPMTAMFYKYANKDVRLGLLTAFLGLTVGYGVNVVFNYNTYLLGNMTQMAAQAEVDKNYHFSVWSNLYVMLASLIVITVVGTIIIEKFLSPKFPKPKDQIEEELIVSKKALYFSNFVLVAMILMLVYSLIPGYPLSGGLLNPNGNNMMEKVFSDASPFKSALPFLFMGIIMIYSFVYGLISRNFRTINDYNVGLSKGFENMGYAFVLMFFFAQLIAILKWTNLGEVITVNLVDILGKLPISGIPLILGFIFIVLIASIFIPSDLTKWLVMSPIIVPLFMRANITPDFCQLLFQISDGIGKAMSPLFPYFIILVAFLYKYRKEETVTIFGTMKQLRVPLLLFTCLWLLIVIGWYIIGLPTGFGSAPTL